MFKIISLPTHFGSHHFAGRTYHNICTILAFLFLLRTLPSPPPYKPLQNFYGGEIRKSFHVLSNLNGQFSGRNDDEGRYARGVGGTPVFCL